MQKNKIFRAYLAWILTLCMILSGSAMTGIKTAAAAEDAPGAEDSSGVIGGAGTSENAEPNSETASDTCTVTFNYGQLDNYFSENNYVINGKTYRHTITVPKGTYVYNLLTDSGSTSSENAVLPDSGEVFSSDDWKGCYFNEWHDASGNYLYGSIEEDITLTASYYYKVTYHAGNGHFYDGSTEYTKTVWDTNPLMDISPCCYSGSNSKAFIGWSLTEDGEVPLRTPGITRYESYDMYAVYTDGYPITFDVGIDGGSFTYYYESYRDTDGYVFGTLGENRYLESGTTKLTLTYPTGVKPSEANYFCLNPFYYGARHLEAGENKKIFANYWSKVKDGKDGIYFENWTPAEDGNDILYAIWSDYWTVSFDSNKEESEWYTPETVKVAKGKPISDMPFYSNYQYSSDDGNSTFTCTSFNTKKDGTGKTVDSSFIPEEDITVYAQYKEVYSIYLSANEGQFYSYYGSSFNIDKGDEVDEKIAGLDYIILWEPKEGEEVSRKVLGSWNTKEDGSGQTPPFTPSKNTTLYAIPEDGVLVTFRSDANEQNDDTGGLFYFRGKNNITKATAAYSTKRVMGYDMPSDIRYPNDKLKSFAGWSTVYGDASKIIDPYTFIPKEDMTLYAIWNDLVPVTYHANGGQFYNYSFDDTADNSTYTSYPVKGGKFSPYDAAPPSLDGYVFAGWSAKDGSSNVIPYGTKYEAAEALDFYAVWEKGYTITLDGNGGYVHYMSAGGHEHYGGDGTTAKFVIKIGSAVLESPDTNEEDHDEGQVYTNHPDNLVLAGWSKSKTGTDFVDLNTYVPEGDETFYAIWEEPYTVTYDAGEAGILDEWQKIAYVKQGGTVSSLPVPTSATKYFAGWYVNIGTDSEAPFGLSTVIDKNTTVTAKWTGEEDLVTVTFNAGNGGTLYDSQSGEYVPSLTIQAAKGGFVNFSYYTPRTAAVIVEEDEQPAAASLRFGGWKTDGYTWARVSAERYYTVTKDTVFTAIWKQTEYYTVTFDGNGGLVDSVDRKDDPSESLELPVEEGDSIHTTVYAYKDGDDAEFTGWYLDKECTQLAAAPNKIAAYKPAGNITLYADWETKKVSVTGIKLLKEKITLGYSEDKADSFELGAVVYPSNATNDKVTYKSSNENVATVSSTGRVTAAGTGEATITATTDDGGFTATCLVTVTNLTAGDIKDKIDTVLTALNSDSAPDTAEGIQTAVMEALSELGGVERLSELASSDSEVAAKLKDLETAYITKADITVDEPSDDQNVLSAIKNILGVDATKTTLDIDGAGLSADPGDQVSLSIKEVSGDKQAEIDDKYTKAKQLDIELNVKNGEGDTKAVTELKAPVTLTMPIPSGMISSQLYIMHFNKDGTYELIRPIFKNNAMTFTVSHFSLFVIAELVEGEIISGGDEEPSPSLEPSPDSSSDPVPSGDPSPGSSSNPVPSGDPSPGSSSDPVPSGDPSPGSSETSPSPSADTGNPASSPAPSSDTGTSNPSASSAPSQDGSGTASTAAPDSGSSAGTQTQEQAAKNGDVVTESGGKYKIISTADKTIAYTSCTANSGKITIKSAVTIGSSTYTVVSIADNAFKKKNITSVVIPSTVESIGKNAFHGAAKLKSVSIKGSRLKTIGSSAFNGCSSLTKITFPKSVKTVGAQAFANCKKLKTLAVKSKSTKFLKNSLKNVPSSAKLTLPNMTAKEKNAFRKMLIKTAGYKGKIK